MEQMLSVMHLFLLKRNGVTARSQGPVLMITVGFEPGAAGRMCGEDMGNLLNL